MKQTELPSEILNKSECIVCFREMKNIQSETIALFEFHADKLFDKFDQTAEISVKAMEATAKEKMELHFEIQSKKEDVLFKEHLIDQGLKHDKYLLQKKKQDDEALERKEKRETKTFNTTMAIITLLALIIGYSYIKQDLMQTDLIKMKYEMDAKPSKKEVPTMNEIQMLVELGIQYNKSVFTRKEFVIADTSAYYYARKNTYGGELRGVPKFLKEDYDKVTKDSKN